MRLRRRDFIALLGGAATWPLAARAQQRAMPVVGLLASGFPETSVNRVTAFRHGLNETGYVDGQNVAVEYRWAEGRYDRFPALVADLIRRKASVIATPGNPLATRVARAATSTIQIVFAVGDRPGQARSGRKPRPAGRQPDRGQFFCLRAGGKAARAVARNGAEGDACSRPRQSGQHRDFRVHGERCAGRGSRPRAANPNLQCPHHS
jgi:hypothetical protein